MTESELKEKYEKLWDLSKKLAENNDIQIKIRDEQFDKLKEKYEKLLEFVTCLSNPECYLKSNANIYIRSLARNLLKEIGEISG